MDEKWDGKEERRHANQDFQHEERRHHSHEHDVVEEKAPTISLKNLGIVLGIVVSLGSLTGGIVKISERYVTVESNTQMFNKFKSDISTSQDNLAKNGKRLFIMMYEDQLDDIEFKIQNGTASDAEKAKKARIERRIETIRRGDF